MEKKIKVINMSNGRVVVNSPALRFRRVWERKGAAISIDFALLEELKYNIGFERLLQNGTLYIEDMDTKKELGLEPMEADEPVNIIILSDEQKEEVLTGELNKLKDVLLKFSRDQKIDLARYAIEKEITDFRVNDILKRETGIDVLNAIRINRDLKEAVKQED